MTEPPFTAKDVEEAFGKVDFEKLIRDVILETGAQELLMPASYGNRFADTEKTMFGRKYNSKKIKRRLSYDVWYWSNKGYRVSKYFESSKKARNYVNHIYTSGLMKDVDYVRMEKTFCYRNHSPRHKWFYISEKPNTFICVEKY